MPILTRRIRTEGVLVNGEIGWSRGAAKVARLAHQPIPPPIRVGAVIDTGSDITCVDTAIIRQLAPGQKGVIFANVPATGGVQLTASHEVSLRVIHPGGNAKDDLLVTDLLVLELHLSSLGYQVLIGRDVLAGCKLLYHGPRGRFRLIY